MLTAYDNRLHNFKDLLQATNSPPAPYKATKDLTSDFNIENQTTRQISSPESPEHITTDLKEKGPTADPTSAPTTASTPLMRGTVSIITLAPVAPLLDTPEDIWNFLSTLPPDNPEEDTTSVLDPEMNYPPSDEPSSFPTTFPYDMP